MIHHISTKNEDSCCDDEDNIKLFGLESLISGVVARFEDNACILSDVKQFHSPYAVLVPWVVGLFQICCIGVHCILLVY